MGKIPTPEEALELVKQYNKEPFHLEHAQIVSKVMEEFAKEYDPERMDFWQTTWQNPICIPQSFRSWDSGI